MRHRFSYVTSVITYIALLLGNLVVATNAGDACGTGYPKCNGYWLPRLNDSLVIIEYSHRLFTGGLGFLILLNFIIAWKRKFKGETAVKIIAPLSLVLLLAQAAVGGINVLLDTPPGFTTFDVTISLALLGSLVLLTTALRRKDIESLNLEKHFIQKIHSPLLIPSFITLILFYFEVIIGAFFKHSGASKTLFGIPYSERLIGSIELSDLIYNVHGIITFLVLISACWLLFNSLRVKTLVRTSSLFLFFILLNGLIGFITVLTELSVLSSSIHMMVASATIGIGTLILGSSIFGEYFIKRS